jgi:putative transcriptional regulator
MEPKTHSYFSGQLLLSMPHMSDPRFHKAAILVCAHDKKGAMGIVINHALPDLEFGKLLQDLDIKSDIQLPTPLSKLPVMCGGPVEIARGFLVHSDDFKQDDTISIDENINVTGTIDAIEAVAKGSAPEQMIFALGYAGWAAGQIEDEIKENAWMMVPASSHLIFETSPEEIWAAGMLQIGINPALLSDQIGQA